MAVYKKVKYSVEMEVPSVTDVEDLGVEIEVVLLKEFEFKIGIDRVTVRVLSPVSCGLCEGMGSLDEPHLPGGECPGCSGTGVVNEN